MRSIAIAIVLTTLTAGCDKSDQGRVVMSQEWSLQTSRTQLDQLNRQNSELLTTQKQTVRELEGIRLRQKALEDDISTARSLQVVMSSSLMLTGCAFAACGVALWRTRRQKNGN